MASFLSSLRSVCTLAACAALAAGCAQSDVEEEETGASEDAQVATAVVVADAKAIAVAEVFEDRVRLPLAVADRYRQLTPGAIFVGARGASKSKNPDGFLRRVAAVTNEGDALVVITTPATLTDAIVNGAMRASSGGGSGIDDHALTRSELRGIEIDFGGEPLFENVDEIDVEGGKARFTESITFERALLAAKPVVEVDLRIQDSRIRRFVAKVEGNLDTSARAIASVTAEGDVNDATLAELRARKHDVRRVIYQSPRVPLPTMSIGRVPLSPSVQFTVALHCNLAFGGPLVANAGVEAKSYVRLGAVLEGGEWQPPIASDFDIRPSFSMERGGQVEARCAVEVDAELFAYGTSGVTMSVAPYVDFGVRAAGGAPALGFPEGYRFRVVAGASGAMRGRADVFGVRPEELDRALVEWKAPEALEGSAR
ncbi:MAG: hypothetical protein KF819_24180 [Labilithrix sp.]|nr:hypothetical protein [Labilithrix sp.]